MARWQSAIDFSSFDDSYYEYLQLAHRRPTYQHNAPTMSWHIAFWWDYELSVQGEDTSSTWDPRTIIESHLNPLLSKLQTHFSKRPGDEPDQNLRQFTYRKSRGGKGHEMVWPYSLNFIIRWGQIIIRCVVSYSSYFCTFTFIVDLEASIRNRASSVSGPKIDEIIQAFKTGIGRVDQVRENYAEPINFSVGVPWRDEDPTQQEAETAAFLFANFWASFGDEIRGRLQIPKSERLFPGRIFADFRGIVARIDPQWESAVQPRGNILDAAEEERRDLGLEHKQFSDLEARWVLSAIWPFFKTSNPGRDTDTRRKDSIACLMLKKQVLYISSLGAHEDIDIAERFLRTHGQGPDLNPLEYYPPVCYIMLVKARPNRRQLGRLIERINSLGTLRLGALRDYSTFREISRDLRIFGSRLDSISTDLIAISQNISGKRVAGYPNDISHEQWLVEKKLTQLATDINNSSNKIPGGIHNRAARTRIIVNAFKQRVDDLRIDRIEFWQPYDEFVRRTLYETYDFVMSVDERMQILRSRLRQVLTAVQTTALVELTTGIRELNEDTNKLTEGILQIERSAGALQAILFIFAVSAFFGELSGALIDGMPYLATYLPLGTEYIRPISENSISESPVSAGSVSSLAKVFGYILGFGVAILLYPVFSIFSEWLTKRRKP